MIRGGGGWAPAGLKVLLPGNPAGGGAAGATLVFPVRPLPLPLLGEYPEPLESSFMVS